MEFVRDGYGGVTVMVDGHPQSYVDTDDPANLGFEYLDHIAAVLDALNPPPPAPLRVTHIGGAGLALARYVQHVRPGSPQIVLEPDTAVTEAVRTELPLPRGHRIRVRPVDGRTGLAPIATTSADVVVLDAYAGGRVPAELTTVEALAEMARVLVPGGVLAANIADDRDGRYVARVSASATAAGFTGVRVIATHEVLKGRRFGNRVVVASSTTSLLDESRLTDRVRGSGYPAGIWGPSEVSRRIAGAAPLTDADKRPSPEPPDASRWRR